MAERGLLRPAARLFVLGVWTSLGGLSLLLTVDRAVAVIDTGAIGVTGLVPGTAALRGGAVAAVLLGSLLAVLGGAAVLATVR